MNKETVQNMIALLDAIEQDNTVPKNIRAKIKEATAILANEELNISLRIDKSLEHLGDLTENPNLPPYTRMQVWSLVSQLESS